MLDKRFLKLNRIQTKFLKTTTNSPKHIFVSLCLILFSFLSNAQVTSSIDSTSIKIGEELKYTIEVVADTTALVGFSEGQPFLPLEIIESYKVDTTYENAKYRLIKKYGLTQFDSGTYTIPPQRVFIGEKIYTTDSVSVEVRDVVVDTTTQKMYDIKPAMEVKSPPFSWDWLYFILPALLVLGLLGYYLFRRKKKKDAEEKQLPPYEEAITALHVLDSSSLLKERKSKEYYSQLTEIVKRYLDREVDETALESTTDELIERLNMHKQAGHFEFDTETIRHLDQILKRADLVKFAKMEQAEGQAQADRATVESIINETHEVIPEPTEEELQANEEYREMLRKKHKRKQWALAIGGVIVALLLGMIVYGSVTGFDNLKDKIVGNELRDLSEGRWVRSEYGYPAVILETPEVLVRTGKPASDSLQQFTPGKSTFTYGDTSDPLFISVSTLLVPPAQQQQEQDLEKGLDSSLEFLEKQGAKNMLVKRDDFETNKGIKGVRAYGTFNAEVAPNRIQEEKSTYELFYFAQQGGVQQVLIVYKEDGRFAEDIKERIVRSIELEISETKK